MRRMLLLAPTFASGIACVSLAAPSEVAECRTSGTCTDRTSDASPDGWRKDAGATTSDGRRPPGASDGKEGGADADVGAPLCDRDGSSATAGFAYPTDIVITVGDKQLGLFWTAVPGASQYRVSRSTTEAGTFTDVALSSATSYLDQPLTNGTTYYYVVAASNGSCWSGNSPVKSGTPSVASTDRDCSQTSPTNLRASSSGSVQVSLSWTTPENPPASYSVFRSETSGSGYELIGAVAATATTYTDADASLLNDTRYYYRVSPEPSCVATASEVSVVTACLSPDSPQAPTVSNANGTITVAWQAVSGATAYSVHRDSSTTGTFAEVVSRNQAGLDYTDPASGLINGQTYHYKVLASNGAGQCASPLSVSASAMSCAPPDTPVGLKANLRGLKDVELTWTAAKGASQYAVLRGTSRGTEVDVTPPGMRVTATSYTDSGLTADTTYYYRVRAQAGANNACTSSPSAEATATPTNCTVLPGSKNNFTANTTSAYCFVTCWDLPVGVAGVGLNAVNFRGRTFTINGLPINCPSDCTLPTNLTKDHSTFPSTGAYVFRVTAGPDGSANNTWWSPKPGRDCQ